MILKIFAFTLIKAALHKNEILQRWLANCVFLVTYKVPGFAPVPAIYKARGARE